MAEHGTVLGVIGGSGLYDVPDIELEKTLDVETPFGKPSGPVIQGRLGDIQVFFLARHGIGHRFTPSEVNYRANIYAMKKLGVTHLLSVSAVGSLREGIEPGHLVVPDQLIDRTKGNRKFTFFGDGIVVHVPLAHPYCRDFAETVRTSAQDTGATVHAGGTLVVIEGPQFSTQAESFLFRSWNADMVGMTAMPEARLAREASLCYSTLALATDYDCWHEDHDSVTVEGVVEVMKKNVQKARQTLVKLATRLQESPACGCEGEIGSAVITDHSVIPEETLRKVKLLLD